MEAHGGKIIKRQAGFRTETVPYLTEKTYILFRRIPAAGNCRICIDRPPKIADTMRISCSMRFYSEDMRILRNDHSNRPCPLGHLAGRAEPIPGDIRCYHERAFPRMGAHIVARRHQTRGAAKTGFFDFNTAAPGGQSYKAMDK